MNTTDRITSLVDRINNAYNIKWAQAEEGKPQIIFDKEACCKPPFNFAHNLWWAYVQPQDRPSVAGYGKTLVEALQTLLDQLKLSPQEWKARCDAEHHDLRLSADLNGITKAIQLDKLNTKTTAQPKLNVALRSQDVPSASMPAPSIPNSGPVSQPPLSKKAKKAAKASGPLQRPRSAFDVFYAPSLQLQEAREKKQRKEKDMDFDKYEQEWERKGAEKQAHERAEVSAAQQGPKFELDGSKTFGPAPSSDMDQGMSSNRFVQTTRPVFDSNSFHFGINSTASSFHFGSDITSKHVTAHSEHFAKPANTPFQTTNRIQDSSLSHNVTMSTNSSQGRSQLGNNFSSRPESSVVDEHVRKDRLKHGILESVDMQQASKKIKLEDTAQDSGSPANESTTAVTSLRRSPSLSEWQPLDSQKVEKNT